MIMLIICHCGGTHFNYVITDADYKHVSSHSYRFLANKIIWLATHRSCWQSNNFINIIWDVVMWLSDFRLKFKIFHSIIYSNGHAYIDFVGKREGCGQPEFIGDSTFVDGVCHFSIVKYDSGTFRGSSSMWLEIWHHGKVKWYKSAREEQRYPKNEHVTVLPGNKYGRKSCFKNKFQH